MVYSRDTVYTDMKEKGAHNNENTIRGRISLNLNIGRNRINGRFAYAFLLCRKSDLCDNYNYGCGHTLGCVIFVQKNSRGDSRRVLASPRADKVTALRHFCAQNRPDGDSCNAVFRVAL